MTYRLSPRLKELGWADEAGEQRRTMALSTPATKWSHGAGTSAITPFCSASRRTDVRLVNVAEEIDRPIER
jgi:hypothetical protein